ncbi:hypothetical protein Btru_035272 [Bulinus truncatus]|nr:hypothetical protein Btru_035272 [Bulinus truncatus]
MASVIKLQDKKDKVQSGSDNTKPSTSSSNRNSQKQLLQGAIKRKSTENKSEVEEKKQKVNEDECQEKPDAKLMAGVSSTDGLMVVAGILPGIADYAEDDSSTENDSNSSDSEADHMIMPSAPTQRLIQEMVQRLNEMKEGGCG